MSFPGRVNVYTCAECKGETVTIDLEDGDTPIFARCPKCNAGTARSAFYECAQARVPTHGWRKPLAAEWAKLPAYRQGQLVLAPLPSG